MFIYLPMWIIDTWFYASYVATYMYSDFRRVCYLILQNVPKLLCASVANAAGICETSKSMKWHQKILWKEIDVQHSGNCCTHAVGRKDLTLICPLTQARAAHTTQQCAPVVYIFAFAYPYLTTLADIQTWPEWKVEEVSQGVGGIRHKNRSYWLCCMEATKSWVTEAWICFLTIFVGDMFAAWRPL